MKIIFLLIAMFSFNSMACLNSVSIKEAEKIVAANGDASVGNLTCGSDDCVCSDGIVWPAAEIVEISLDGKPKYGEKQNVTSCESEKECEVLRGQLCSKIPDSFFFYAENSVLPGYEAYCTVIVGYEQIKQKVVVNNMTKLSAVREAEVAKRDQEKTNAEKKKLAIERIRQFSSSGLDNATTVAGVKAAVKAALVDIIEILK